MKRLLSWISIALSTVVPITIVLNFNLIKSDGSWNVGIVSGLLLFVIFYFAIYKRMNEKIHVWEIQGGYDFVVENYKRLRTIFMVGMLWLGWVTLNANYEQIYDTFIWVMASLITGLIIKNIALSLD